MNKLCIFFIFSTLFSQPQESDGILEIIQKNAINLNKQKNNPLEKKFVQAKNLERAGLYEEALLLFKEINQEQPGNRKYFQSMKYYLKQTEAWDTLHVYTQSYANARNQDFQSQLEFIDLYIWKNEDVKWKQIIAELMGLHHENENSIKIIIQILVNNGQHDFAYERLIKYRQDKGTKDFYSMEMATYFGMRMAYDKSVTEYLVFLEHHPQNFQNISDRIMAFPSTPNIIQSTTSILIKSPLKIAQFILADLKFKHEKYDQGYDLLKMNGASHLMLLEYAKDLVSVKEFMKAEKILTEIIKSKDNEKIMTAAVFEIANILESKMIINSPNLPISGFYAHNPFFSSPYMPVKEEASMALEKAMDIYDSLRVSKKNAQAAFRLAEIQFRILGDLDGAYYLYNEAYDHGNSHGLRLDAGLGMINIHIAKGDLKTAEDTFNQLKKQHANDLEYDVKLAQIKFYQEDFETTDNMLREIINDLSPDHAMYNDILNVIAILIAFRHNQEEYKEFVNIQLHIQQNKRIEAIEKLAELFDSNEIYITGMCRYQQAWLTFLQDDIETVKNQLQLIQDDTIFKEMAHLFQSEILDYMENDISNAIDKYLEFLELYPNSIYYDDVRLRLRELTS